MSDGVTYQALKRLSWLPERETKDNGNVIAGQEYYDVYFTGGTISGVTLDDVTIENFSIVGQLGLANGGTGADLSATGGTHNVVQQTSAGAAFTVGQLSFSDLSGNIAVSQMNSGTGASSSTYWRGDGTWASIAGGVTSVTGTTNRITSTGGTTPVIDIDTAYVGQSSITTLGTIATGVWNGTKIGLAYGGTNADLSATGGTSQVLKQTSVGGTITVAQLAFSDLSGNISVNQMNSGTGASSSTYWRGDGTWTSGTVIVPYLVGDGTATASGTHALALGNGATGTGQYAISIGYGSQVTNLGSGTANASIAIGTNAICRNNATAGNTAIVIGNGALNDNGINNITIGASATAHVANSSVIIGNNASSVGNNSVTIGDGAQSTSPGNSNVVIGVNSQSAGTWGVAIGASSNANGTGAIAIGVNSTASGDGAINIGSSTNAFGIDSSFNYYLKNTSTVYGITSAGVVSKYNSISTAGYGVPAIYGNGRFTAQTAAKASVATYTLGASDGSFIVSANVNVTTATTHNFTVTCTYTDETNTSQTLTLNFAQPAGTIATAITNVTGAGPYEGLPMHIRCKASTSITIATTGTFTSVVYNVEGNIRQIS